MSEPTGTPPLGLTRPVWLALIDLFAKERFDDIPAAKLWEVAEVIVSASKPDILEAEDRGREEERKRNDDICQARLDELSRSTDKGVNYRRMELKKLRRRIEGGQT